LFGDNIITQKRLIFKKEGSERMGEMKDKIIRKGELI
jgi:hypothetical protein